MENGISGYISLLLEQKVFIIVFCVSASLASLAQTYIFSEKYETVTSFHYRAQEITRLRDGDIRAFGAPLPTIPFKVINQNLQEIVKSEAILRPIVIELGLDQEEESIYEGDWYVQLYEKTKDLTKEYAEELWTFLKYGRQAIDNPTTAAIKGLRQNIELNNATSYIFNLIVKDADPQQAARLADAIAYKLIDWLQQQQQSPAAKKMAQMEILLKVKENKIDFHSRAIEGMLLNNNIVSVDIETERSMERLSDLKLSGENLKSEIAHTRAKLAVIIEKKKKKNPRLDNQQKIKEHSDPIQPQDYIKLNSDQLFTEIDLTAMELQYETLQSSISQLEMELAQLPYIDRKLGQHQIQLERVKREYTQLSDVYQEAAVQATGEFSEIKVLHEAHIPSIPISPIKIYHVGLTAFLALFISIGLVFLLSYANIRFLFSPGTSTDRINTADRRPQTDRAPTPQPSIPP